MPTSGGSFHTEAAKGRMPFQTAASPCASKTCTLNTQCPAFAFAASKLFVFPGKESRKHDYRSRRPELNRISGLATLRSATLSYGDKLCGPHHPIRRGTQKTVTARRNCVSSDLRTYRACILRSCRRKPANPLRAGCMSSVCRGQDSNLQHGAARPLCLLSYLDIKPP